MNRARLLPVEGQLLPDEPKRLAIGMWGAKDLAAWSGNQSRTFDFFDLKGVLEGLLQGLQLQNVEYRPLGDHPTFHPGKAAGIYVGEELIGLMGEIHPLIRQNYDFPEGAILVAELYLDLMLALVEKGFQVRSISTFPAMVEDIALIVDENVPASQVEALIRKAGGKLLVDVRLFDLFRSEKLGQGKKSLAYQLIYQAFDRTLSVADAAAIRKKIVKLLGFEIGAILRDS